MTCGAGAIDGAEQLPLDVDPNEGRHLRFLGRGPLAVVGFAVEDLLDGAEHGGRSVERGRHGRPGR
jgi:hypothetical protein